MSDYIGFRLVCQRYRVSPEVVRQNISDGLLRVFAHSGGQFFFRTADIEAVFDQPKPQPAEQD